jgi:hypothetical protein
LNWRAAHCAWPGRWTATRRISIRKRSESLDSDHRLSRNGCPEGAAWATRQRVTITGPARPAAGNSAAPSPTPRPAGLP